MFDPKFRFALGLRDFYEGNFELRTIYNFRSAVSAWEEEHGINLIQKASGRITLEKNYRLCWNDLKKCMEMKNRSRPLHRRVFRRCLSGLSLCRPVPGKAAGKATGVKSAPMGKTAVGKRIQ